MMTKFKSVKIQLDEKIKPIPEIKHWADTYPHEIVCSVILKNGKIDNWKIGEYSLKDKYCIGELTNLHPEYSYQEKQFIANNDEQHNRIFDGCARQFLKQWEVHEDYTGSNPFESDLKPGDILRFNTGNVEVIKQNREV